ncbi:hypothetical protein GLOIN_2v1779246 [Rhizophagus clarus]|uniref:Uncharacterized protein n=1 Tax=Rhizophagus clarus TaxID=94130 RepID=A0A8H3QHV7_9GLOM|nr:hypothetical protein GLOIN_2v1779246 [Rhizophagus clarus]
MPSISIKVILSNRKEVLRWQIHPIIGNPLLSEFFHSLVIGQILLEVFINKDYQNFLLKAKIGNSLKDEFVDVNVQYAFKVLISNSIQLSLPSFNLPKKPNKKDLLHHDIVVWIKNNDGGWKGRIAVESIGKSFINDLLNAIWYVDTCGVEKMKGRAIHPPKELEEFFNRSDPSSYKNTRPKFDYNCLGRYANLLFGYLNASWMENSQFTWLYPIRVDESLGNKEITNKSYIICKDLKSKIPTYHTQFMRKQFKYKVDLILGIPTKNHQECALYQELTGDSSSATNMTEKQVILCIKQLIVNENDKIIVDLYNFNKGQPE